MCETIAAISTAYGEGGIGIIRISGPESLSILRRIFDCKSNIKSRRMTYGKIVDPENDIIIDEVLAVYMKAPSTYTGEDVVEINCHGSMVSLRKTLALVLREGARMAEPEEFTKRAFLKGRLDLSQAEAVIDVIKAKADASYEAALSQMEGSLSRKVREIRTSVLDILVETTVNIDYPDEDIEQLTYDKLLAGLETVGDEIRKLLATADTGRMIKEGIRVAIVGRPNVGKSSLMNCLLRQSRAIVTEIPGTTRDTIEEAVSIRNIPVYLIDTAGIRETEDVVEKIGVSKAKEYAEKADFIIYVIDSSTSLDDNDFEIMEILKDKKAVVLLNKSDLDVVTSKEDVSKYLDKTIIAISAKENTGITELENTIKEMFFHGEVSFNDAVYITNIRQKNSLQDALDSLNLVVQSIEDDMPEDFYSIDLMSAYESLGKMIGESVEDDLVNEIFSKFCMGK
jgi:tRNA modification GTPase